jgi:hypothetical protein
MLVQIGMASGTVKNNPAVFIINAVYQKPVRFNMTFTLPVVFSMQGMVFMFWQQGLFVNKQSQYFSEFVHILVAFFHQLAVFFERAGKRGIQHGLIVQISQHFLKGIVPLGRYLTTEHGVAFFKGRNSLGVKTLFSGYRITVRGADGTFARKVKPAVSGLIARQRSFRGKGKNNTPRRYFAGYVNSQPVVGGYFYGLCNAHKENVV